MNMNLDFAELRRPEALVLEYFLLTLLTQLVCHQIREISRLFKKKS